MAKPGFVEIIGLLPIAARVGSYIQAERKVSIAITLSVCRLVSSCGSHSECIFPIFTTKRVAFWLLSDPLVLLYYT